MSTNARDLNLEMVLPKNRSHRYLPKKEDEAQQSLRMRSFSVPVSNPNVKLAKIKERGSNLIERLWRFISENKLYYVQFFQRMLDTDQLINSELFGTKLSLSPFLNWLKYFLTDCLRLSVEVHNKTLRKSFYNETILPVLFAAPMELKLERKIVCFLCYLELPQNEYQLHLKHNYIKSYFTNTNTYSPVNLDFKCSMFAWLAGLHAFVKLKKKTPFNIQVVVFPYPIYDCETLENFVKEHKDFFQHVDLFIQTNDINPLVKKPSTVWASKGLGHFRLKLTITNDETNASSKFEDSKAEINKYVVSVLNELNKWCQGNYENYEKTNKGFIEDGIKKSVDPFEINLESVQHLAFARNKEENRDEKFVAELRFNIPYWKKEQLCKIENSVHEIVHCWSEKLEKNINCELNMDYYSNPWNGKQQDVINCIAKKALFKVTQENPTTTINERPLQLAEIIQRLFGKTVLAIWFGKQISISANSMRNSYLIQSMKVVTAIIKGIYETKPDFRLINPKILDFLNKYKVPQITVMDQLVNHYSFKKFKQERKKYWKVFMWLRGILVSPPKHKLSAPKIEPLPKITHFLLEYTAPNRKKYSTSCNAEDMFNRYNDYILQAIQIENLTGNKKIQNKMKDSFLNILRHKKYTSDVLQKFCKFYHIPEPNTYQDNKKKLDNLEFQVRDFNEIKQIIRQYKYIGMFHRQWRSLDKNPLAAINTSISIPAKKNKKLNEYFSEMIKRALPKKPNIGQKLLKFSTFKKQQRRITKTSKIYSKSQTRQIEKHSKSNSEGLIRYIDHLEDFTFSRTQRIIDRFSNISIIEKQNFKSKKWLKEFKEIKVRKLKKKALTAQKIIFSNTQATKSASKSSSSSSPPHKSKRQKLAQRDGLNPSGLFQLPHKSNVCVFDEWLTDDSTVIHLLFKDKSNYAVNSHVTTQFDKVPDPQLKKHKPLRDSVQRKQINKKWLKIIKLCRKCKTKPLIVNRDSSFIKKVKEILNHIYIDGNSQIDLIFKQIIHDTLEKRNQSMKIKVIKKLLKSENTVETNVKKILSQNVKNFESANDNFSLYLQLCLLNRENIEKLLRQWQYKNMIPEQLEAKIFKMLSKNLKYFIDAKKKCVSMKSRKELVLTKNIYDEKIHTDENINIHEIENLISECSEVPTKMEIQSQMLPKAGLEALYAPYISPSWRFMFMFIKTKCKLLLICYRHVHDFYNREYKHLYQGMMRGPHNTETLEHLSSYLVYNKAISKIHTKLLRNINYIEALYFNKPVFFDQEWLPVIKSSIRKPLPPPNFKLEIASNKEDLVLMSDLMKPRILDTSKEPNKNIRSAANKNTSWNSNLMNIIPSDIIIINKELQMEDMIRKRAQRQLNHTYLLLCEKYKKILIIINEIKNFHLITPICFLTKWIQLMIAALKPCSTLKTGVPRMRLRKSGAFSIQQLIMNRKIVVCQWKLFYSYYNKKYNLILSILKRIKLIFIKNSPSDKIFQKQKTIRNSINKKNSRSYNGKMNSVTCLEQLDSGKNQDVNPSFIKHNSKRAKKITAKKMSEISTIHDFSDNNIMKCSSFFRLRAAKFRSIWLVLLKLNKNLKEPKVCEVTHEGQSMMTVQPHFIAEEYFERLNKLFYNVSFLQHKLIQMHKLRSTIVPEEWQKFIKHNFKLSMPEDLVDKIVEDKVDESVMFMTPKSKIMNSEAESDKFLNLIRKLSPNITKIKMMKCGKKYIKIWQGIDAANVETSIDCVTLNALQLKYEMTKLIALKKQFDNYSREHDGHLSFKTTSCLIQSIHKCCTLVDNYKTFSNSLQLAFSTLLPYIEEKYVKGTNYSELYCKICDFPEKLLGILSEIENEIMTITSNPDQCKCKDSCCPCKEIRIVAKNAIPRFSKRRPCK